jgi:hypothetical protein
MNQNIEFPTDFIKASLDQKLKKYNGKGILSPQGQRFRTRNKSVNLFYRSMLRKALLAPGFFAFFL